jgi:hypothetical protein
MFLGTGSIPLTENPNRSLGVTAFAASHVEHDGAGRKAQVSD